MLFANYQARMGKSPCQRVRRVKRTLLLATLAVVLGVAPTKNTLCQQADQQTNLNTDLSSAAFEALNNVGNSLYRRGAAPTGFAPEAVPWPLSANYLMIALPITYNTNPALVHNGATDSLRFDPKLQGQGSIPIGEADLTVGASGDLDRYPNLSTANANTLLVPVKLSFGRPDPSRVPYLLYQLSVRDSASASPATTTLNDLGVGSKFVLQAWQASDGALKATIDMNFTGRFVSSGTNSTSVIVKPGISYSGKQDFDGSFLPSVRVRWFESGGRRDTTVILPLQVGWYPNALCKFWGGLSGSIQLAVNAVRTFSTIPSHSTRQLDVGPSLEFVTFWGGSEYNC